MIANMYISRVIKILPICFEDFCMFSSYELRGHSLPTLVCSICIFNDFMLDYSAPVKRGIHSSNSAPDDQIRHLQNSALVELGTC